MKLKPDFDFNSCSSTVSLPCVHTVARSDSRVPDMEVVEAMREWAAAQNLLVKPRVISTYLMNGGCKEEPAHYLDIYIPLQR